jgi:2-polyprenyl-6-methoxyphenol hydroxylase-like FAD-dependent oxidoreductase
MQVFYDGFEKHGWDGGNYMIDSEFWGLIAKRGKPAGAEGNLWRVTYGDVPGLSDEEYIARRPTAFRKILPGHPGPGEYTVTQTNRFRIHNRCVEKMRVDRVLLAADAAHVCNPFGGYGCMSAVLDVGGLADCLIGYYDNKADEDILDIYAKIRREKFLNYVDRRSRKNLNRISKTNPDTALETDPFLGLLKDLEDDKGRTRDFLMVRLMTTPEELANSLLPQEMVQYRV